MKIEHSIIVEFGLGTIGVTEIILEPIKEENKKPVNVKGIALEHFIKSFPVGETITKDALESLDHSVPSILLAFHSKESAIVLQEALAKVIAKFDNTTETAEVN